MNAPDANRNRRILVIDDNAAIHADFAKILSAPEQHEDLDAFDEALFGPQNKRTSQPGFQVESAFQGQEGLERVKQAVASARPYAMAFVDVRMPPGWDGVETTTKLWAAYPDLQVVICTAYSDYAWEDLIARVGRSDRLLILKKPFDNVEVLQLANALTEKWRLLQCVKLEINGLQQAVASRTQQWRRSEERFQNLCNFCPFGIFETDRNGRCSYTNPKWQHMTGRSSAESVGSDWCQGVHPEDCESTRASWRQAATQAVEWSQELRLLTPDGDVHWAHLIISPMFSADGALLGFMGTAEDATKRKIIEIELGNSVSADVQRTRSTPR